MFDFVETDIDSCPKAAPPVSVLVPTYNGARLIGATLRSILSQGLPELDVVVVDDGSTDGTPEAVLALGDKRVRLFRTPRNLGPPGARNFGFAHCRGRFIAPVDQDDILLPHRLARQVAYMDVHDETVLVGTATERLHGETRAASPEAAHTSPGYLRWALMVGNPLVWSSVLIRKSALDQLGVFNREDRIFAEDFDLYHRLARIGTLARFDEVLTLYRSHAAGASKMHGAQMRASATAVLHDAYMPILGAGARRAAEIVARHVSYGDPVPNLETLRLIEAMLRALTQHVKSHRDADEVARGLIAGARAALMQNLVRTALRHGTVSSGALRRAGLLDSADLDAGALMRHSVLGFMRGAFDRKPQILVPKLRTSP